MQYLIAFTFALGVFLICEDCAGIPLLSTSAALNDLARRQQVKTSVIDVYLKDFAVWISKHLRLSEYRRIQLETDLRSAGINLSPEMHIADAIVRSLIIAAAAVPAAFIIPWLAAVILILAVLIYLRSSKGVAEKINEKRKQIEYELPRFVAHIDKTLKHNRDVLYIIDSYKENAGKALREELEITAADMRSGNYEAALTRLEARVGSSMLSDTARGLIGVLRGDDTEILWANLAAKFSDYRRILLRAEADKVPGKVKRLSLCLLICFMLMYAAVIGMQIYESLGGLLSL